MGSPEYRTPDTETKALEQRKLQSETDDFAVQKVAEKRAKISYCVSFLGIGTLCFLVVTYILCLNKVGDPIIEAKYRAETSQFSYLCPMIAFVTALIMNIITLIFERDSAKMQLALIACYINALAGFTDFMCWKGYAPIALTSWGHGFQVLRIVMWLHTTPAMVHMLTVISDFTRAQANIAILADIVMISCALGAMAAPYKALSVVFYMMGFSFFSYVMYVLWKMFDGALAEAHSSSSHLNLKVLRLLTVSVWFVFPVIWILVMLSLVSLETEEWLWCTADFLGKVFFSSSLLHGNFLTIEQRRLIAMRIVEESHKIQVIEELQNVLKQKERFMSSMSHELRTPLNGIIGLSDALLVGSCGEMNEPMQKTVNTIKTSGSRLLNLINDILDAASLQQGKLVMKTEKVNLKKIVDDVLDLCHPLARRGVRLLNEVSESVPHVMGDTGRIIQIFNNLIGNSCKFTHAGYISVSANFKFDEVEVAVSDTGIGIPESKFQSIFQAFEQVDMSVTRKYGGTGLGLSLVKQLVDAHSGTVSVRSKVNFGTTFYFTLKVWTDPPLLEPNPDSKDSSGNQGHSNPTQPLGKRSDVRRSTTRTTLRRPSFLAGQAAGDAGSTDGENSAENKRSVDNRLARTLSMNKMASQSSNAGSQAQSGAGKSETLALSLHGHMPMKPSNKETTGRVRVLSVDDDPVNQLVIQNLLAPVGYDIIQAMDGQEALRILEEEDTLPDVILLDVMMPGMSGYEVCRKLRELYPLSCIPVIMISAKSKEEHIVEGLAAGSNDYVVKPFGRQEILARISAHLRFRDSVYHAGELAGCNLDMSLLRHPAAGSGSDLSRLLLTSKRQHSLPTTVRNTLELSFAYQHSEQYSELTMIVVLVVNLESLACQVRLDVLLAAMAQVYVGLEGELERHGAYVVDRMDSGLTVVLGVNGESRGEQASAALTLCTHLGRLATAAPLPDGRLLQLQIGVHMASANAVVVGTMRPALLFTGMLPVTATRLAHTAPPGCVHCSDAFVSASADALLFSPCTLQSALGPTYLYKMGAWEDGMRSVSHQLATFLASQPHPLNVHAISLKGVQLALQVLMQVSPEGILDSLSNLATKASAELSGIASPHLLSLRGSVAEAKMLTRELSVSNPPQVPVAAEVERLQHEKEMLERQLDLVSQEAERLQDALDSLESQQSTLNTRHEQSKRSSCELEQQLQSSADIIADMEQQLQESKLCRADLESQLSEALALHVELQHRLECADAAQAGLEAKLKELEQQLREARLEAARAHNVVMAAEELAASAQAQANNSVMAHQAALLRIQELQDLQRSTLLAQQHPYSAMDRARLGGMHMEGSLFGGQPAGTLSPSWSYGGQSEASISGMRTRSAPRVSSHPLPMSSPTNTVPSGPLEMHAVLEELGLERLVERFESEDITLDLLPFLDDAALQALGANSIGCRMKLRMAARALSSQ